MRSDEPGPLRLRTGEGPRGGGGQHVAAGDALAQFVEQRVGVEIGLAGADGTPFGDPAR